MPCPLFAIIPYLSFAIVPCPHHFLLVITIVPCPSFAFVTGRCCLPVVNLSECQSVAKYFSLVHVHPNMNFVVLLS
jgi:hypothetical protein